MRTSRRGRALIEKFEGCVLHPYRDAVGVWTIGFGHTGAGVESMGAITRAKADALLASDLKRFEAAVNALRLPLNQNQCDALVSFSFNLGPGYLAHGHSMGDALRRQDWKAAAAAFLLYDRAGGRVLPGLSRRRTAERTLFVEPVKKPAAEKPTRKAKAAAKPEPKKPAPKKKAAAKRKPKPVAKVDVAVNGRTRLIHQKATNPAMLKRVAGWIKTAKTVVVRRQP